MPGLSVIIRDQGERRYPEALRFTQPLSGIIAAGETTLMKLTFEDDYGVDVGLLLDAVEAVAVGAAMQTAARSVGGWRSEESGCWWARGYAFGGWADRRRAYERKGEA